MRRRIFEQWAAGDVDPTLLAQAVLQLVEEDWEVNIAKAFYAVDDFDRGMFDGPRIPPAAREYRREIFSHLGTELSIEEARAAAFKLAELLVECQ